jgi:hypothetical protein
MTDESSSTSDLTLPESTGGHHLLRWLVLVALGVGLIVAGRRFAISRSDQELEQQLRMSDFDRE